MGLKPTVFIYCIYKKVFFTSRFSLESVLFKLTECSTDVAELESLALEIASIGYGLENLLGNGSMVVAVNGETFTVTEDNILSMSENTECAKGQVRTFSYCGEFFLNQPHCVLRIYSLPPPPS